MNNESILPFYKTAREFVINAGYQWEIELVQNRTWGQATPIIFFEEYVFVVLNAGMKNQVAQKMYDTLFSTMNRGGIICIPEGGSISDARIKSLNVSVIGHEGKRKAISTAQANYVRWFKELQNITPESLTTAMGMDWQKTDPKKKMAYDFWMKALQERTIDELRTAYLQTLPWIGKITKYHLARNLGMDVAKPDVHLVRLKERFRFEDVLTMCTYISQRTDDRIGTVDVVLWRYSNLNGSNGDPKQKTLGDV